MPWKDLIDSSNNLELSDWDWKIFLAIMAIYLIVLTELLYRHITKPIDTMKSDSWNVCIIKTWWFEDNCISFWPITHFLLYFTIALALPVKYYKYFVVAGIVWELAEFIGGKCLSKEKRETQRNYSGNKQYDQWLAGRWGDLVANMLGMFTGWALKVGAVKGYQKIKTPVNSPASVEVSSDNPAD